MSNKPFGQLASAPFCSVARRAPRLLLCIAAMAAAGLVHAQLPPQQVLGTWSHVPIPTGYTEMRAAGVDNAGRVIANAWGPNLAQTAVLYSNGQFTEIANFGLAGSSVSDFSNAGRIVGSTLDRGDPPRRIAFIQQPNGTSYVLPGPPEAAQSHASHVNDFGEVVGGFYREPPNSPNALQEAFFYDRSGQRHALGWGGYTVVSGLNNAGQVVGSGRVPGNDALRAFTYRDGVTSDLGTLGGSFAYAEDVNDAGQIVGTAALAGEPRNEPRHAVLWENGRMTDLGTFGGRDSSAQDINNAGDLVGSAGSGPGREQHAFLWRDGVMHDLGTFGGASSFAHQINERGDVVGMAELDALDYKGNPVRHAFLWRDGQLIDLNASLAASFSGMSHIDPYSVLMNDAGYITLYGINTDGRRGVFLLTPIPEPEVCTLMLAGLLALGARGARRPRLRCTPAA